MITYEGCRNAMFNGKKCFGNNRCSFYYQELWDCYGTIIPYSLIQPIINNEAVKDLYLGFSVCDHISRTWCSVVVLDKSQHQIIESFPQFYSQIHKALHPVCRHQLQHRRNRFHLACCEAVMHWSVTLIWNLIYLFNDRFIHFPNTSQQCSP